MPFLIGSKEDQTDQAVVDGQEGLVLYQMITRQPAEVPTGRSAGRAGLVSEVMIALVRRGIESTWQLAQPAQRRADRPAATSRAKLASSTCSLCSPETNPAASPARPSTWSSSNEQPEEA